jgi:hypothetical protein
VRCVPRPIPGEVADILLTTCVRGELVREIISNVLNDLRDRLDAFRYRRAQSREIISNVRYDLLDRFDAFRSRLAQSRFYRAGKGIAVVLAIAALVGVGVLAATAIARSDSETPSVAPSNAARVSSASVSSSSRREVVTETVRRQGRTVRVVRQRPGTAVQDVVTLPARTVRETHTVTTREVATVTAIQAVTVTVIETVTCKLKEC